MGLLDSLFNQSSYGGQGGGLLDFLRQSQMQQEQYQPSAGFPGQASPIAVGGYQMQPAFGPQGEGNFTTGLRALGNPGGAINKIADAVQGFTTGQTPTQRQQSQLFQAYVSSGMSPSQAYVAVLNPQLASSMMGGGKTDDIKEYEYARKETPGLTFEKFMLQKKANQGEYSLTPQYGTDKDGNTVLIQTGKSGEAIRTKLPEGVKVSSGVEKIDAGDKWILYDKRTGTPVGTQPKDLVSKEAAEERGKAQGQAQAKIPAALIDAEETTKKIDELLKNEGLDSIVGSVDQYRPSWALGENGRKALSQLEQLQGGAFLQAFNTLKGGGAITEIEGQKAERAIARMQRYQGEADFKEALMEFRDAVKTGIRKLQASASSGGAPAAPAAPPKRIRLNPDGTIAQ
jgi:hypothetical protein